MALPYNSASFTEHSFGIQTYDEVKNTYGGSYTDPDSGDTFTAPLASIFKVTYLLQGRIIGEVIFGYSGSGNLEHVKRIK